MSLPLATKGVLCPPMRINLPLNPFSPILRFDVVLDLRRPSSLLVQRILKVAAPTRFMVENIEYLLDMPSGFMVEGEPALRAPMNFGVEDLTFVTKPMGFAVEDV